MISRQVDGSPGVTAVGRLLRVAAMALALASPAFAAEEEAQEEPREENELLAGWSLQWHGFGAWSYGKTDGNQYLGGDEEGDYQHAGFALNLAAEYGDRLRIHAQLDWQESHDEDEIELDYGFAEWRVSERLRVRAGKVKHPFGIYTEIFDVGVLRPFPSLAQSVYGPVGFVAEAYKGVGVVYAAEVAGSLRLEADLYGGGLTIEEDEPLVADPEGGEPEEEEVDLLRDVAGGRLTLSGPDGRWSGGISMYHGKEEVGGRTVAGGHLQFQRAGWTARTEVARHRERDDDGEAGYLEVSWRAGPRWQVAAIFERLTGDLEVEVPPDRQGHLEHRSVALGLTRWFTDHLAVKLAAHRVRGNRLAVPESHEGLDDPLAAEALERRTSLLELAVNFSF